MIGFKNGFAIAAHLKMTGQFIYQSPEVGNRKISEKAGGKLPNKYTRLIFELDKRGVLYYNDVRRFGWMKIVKREDIQKLPFFKELGPEPFRDLTFEYFSKMLSSLNTPVKPLLMDQSRIGGVGNIYANDALWEAGVNPRKKAADLSQTEKERLYKAIHDVMEFSIEHGAASDNNYVDALGQEGRYQEHFKVYNRAGQACDRCGRLIERIKLGGRGTFFCPHCQK